MPLPTWTILDLTRRDSELLGRKQRFNADVCMSFFSVGVPATSRIKPTCQALPSCCIALMSAYPLYAAAPQRRSSLKRATFGRCRRRFSFCLMNVRLHSLAGNLQAALEDGQLNEHTCKEADLEHARSSASGAQVTLSDETHKSDNVARCLSSVTLSISLSTATYGIGRKYGASHSHPGLWPAACQWQCTRRKLVLFK